MAEFTAMRNNALSYPIYGLPFVVVVPLLDADGDPISPSSPDSEISKNGDTAADCTNEAVEIVGLTGVCYLSLTGTELTCDVAAVEVNSTGAKTTVFVLYPKKLPVVRSGTAADDGSGTSTIVIDSGASAIDDFYNGMVIAAVIDGTTEVRMITDYNGSTKAASVTPDWNTAPDADDTFTIYLPDGAVQIQQANVSHAANTAWNSGAIAAATIATDAIDADALADGAITAAVFAAGAIDAAAVAADAGAEIGTAVWASGTRTLTAIDEDSTTLDLDATIRAALGLASANLDTQLGDLPTNAELATALGTADDAVLAAIAALNNLSFANVWTGALTESYAANGVAPTPAQALFAIHQAIMQFAISGTSKTVKKLDNATTAFVVTHDSATAPTSASRT